MTETVTGLAVTRATGGVQVALTAYVIVLPLLVLAVFTAILWTKPFVLYPPSEFGGSGATLADFVAAMQRRYGDVLARREVDEGKIYEIVRKALDSSIESEAPPAAGDRSLSSRATHLGEATLARIDDQLLTIETAPLGGPEKVRKIPFDEALTIGELLDDVYFSVEGLVRPLSYGTLWVLQDARTNRIFLDMGRSWAAGRGMTADDRKLRDVGIEPGMRLRTIRPPAIL